MAGKVVFPFAWDDALGLNFYDIERLQPFAKSLGHRWADRPRPLESYLPEIDGKKQTGSAFMFQFFNNILAEIDGTGAGDGIADEEDLETMDAEALQAMADAMYSDTQGTQKATVKPSETGLNCFKSKKLPDGSRIINGYVYGGCDRPLLVATDTAKKLIVFLQKPPKGEPVSFDVPDGLGGTCRVSATVPLYGVIDSADPETAKSSCWSRLPISQGEYVPPDLLVLFLKAVLLLSFGESRRCCQDIDAFNRSLLESCGVQTFQDKVLREANIPDDLLEVFRHELKDELNVLVAGLGAEAETIRACVSSDG
jgi:hypothetical protein